MHVNTDAVDLARTLAAEASSDTDGLRAVANTMKNRVDNGINEPEAPETGLQGHRYRIRGQDFRNAAFHIDDDETRSFRDQIFDTAVNGGYAPRRKTRVEDTSQEAREVAATVLSSPPTIVDNVEGAMHFRTSIEGGYHRSNPDFLGDILDFGGDLRKVRVGPAANRVKNVFYAPTQQLIDNSAAFVDSNDPTMGYKGEDEQYRTTHPQEPLGGKTIDEDLP